MTTAPGDVIMRNCAEIAAGLAQMRAHRGLSNEFCDERGGLTKGHTDKVLGPSHTKQLSEMTLDTFMEMFAVMFIMVPNPEAESRMKAKWEGRDESNVRTPLHRISKILLERAKPHVLKEFSKAGGCASASKRTGSDGTDIMRRVADARWKKRGRKATHSARRKRSWYRKTMAERLQDRADKRDV